MPLTSLMEMIQISSPLILLAVQGAQYVVGPVRIGGDEPIVPHLVVNIFLIGLHPPALVPDQRIGHGVLINPPIGGNPALAAGASHQGDAPLPERCVNRGQHAGVVPRTKIDAHRIPSGAAHGVNILLQTADILHRHRGHLLQHIGGRGDAVGKGDYPDAVFHNVYLIAHADAADARNAGKALLQRPHMSFELGVV